MHHQATCRSMVLRQQELTKIIESGVELTAILSGERDNKTALHMPNDCRGGSQGGFDAEIRQPAPEFLDPETHQCGNSRCNDRRAIVQRQAREDATDGSAAIIFLQANDEVVDALFRQPLAPQPRSEVVTKKSLRKIKDGQRHFLFPTGEIMIEA